MQLVTSWIAAARLRTLPLSISGIIVGASMIGNPQILAMMDRTSVAVEGTSSFYTTAIFWLAIATTLGLQILSNFANDYGDGVKGTDNEDRVGPKRALQSGMLTKEILFKGIVITAILTLCIAILLIYVSFGAAYILYSLFFLCLGIAAIAAAIKYTMGTTAYGYRGLGDVFVFLFFGLVSVVGCYFLFVKQVSWIVFLPGVAIGLLSTAVLNLNNMRDHASDTKAGKNTLVVKMGVYNAKKYHYTLLLIAFISLLIFSFSTYQKLTNLLYLIAFIPILLHFIRVVKTKDVRTLDPELKKVALSTFLLSILFSLGQIL